MAAADFAALAEYVERVVRGDQAAWQHLASGLEPLLIRQLRRSRTLGPMRHSVDDCRSVMVNVLSRLHKDDHRSLRLYPAWAEANPGKDFGDWIRILTTNLARDYVTSRLGSAEQGEGEQPRNKRLLNTLATLLPVGDDQRLGARPLLTDAMMAQQLLQYAEQALEPEQLKALHRWMQGATFDELAAEFGLSSPRDADKKIRATLARLRRHFSDEAQ